MRDSRGCMGLSGDAKQHAEQHERRLMKRLFLLRHAKAVPAESGIEDFDRTLMLSGMQDAGAMARYLRKSDYAVDLILCSAAARTVQTAELMLQELLCEIEYREKARQHLHALAGFPDRKADRSVDRIRVALKDGHASEHDSSGG